MKAQRWRGPATTIPAPIGYLHWGAPLAASTADRPGGADHGALLDALGQVAPRVEPDPPTGCYLDLGDRPSGVPRELALAEWGAAILAIAREGGCPAARLGVAPTPGAARLAARHGPANPTVLDGAAIAPYLAALPVRCLELDEATLERLALVGLRTLGDLAALPCGALGDYLGAAGPAIEALARGEDARPLSPVRPPLVLTARRDLDFPLADRAQLAALLHRLVAPLAGELRRQGLGATRATLALGRDDGHTAVYAVPLAAPAGTAPAILRPLLAALPEHRGDRGEHGDEDEEGGGVTAVQVTLSAPRALPARQASLFDTGRERAERVHAVLAGTRRCLAGRLGHLRPVDPHHLLLERRYALDDGPPPGHAGRPPEISEVAATGCCGHGRPIEITGRRGDGAPAGFRWHGRVERVRQVQAAWQLAEGWWRGTQPPHGATRRQYYRVVTAAGLRCDLYHDQVAAGWYLARVLD